MKQNYNDLVKRIQQFSLTCEVKDENGVVHHFHHGHEYVEIGGLKWATMNIGAEKPTDNGLYFAWGDSQGYTADQVNKGVKHFDWDNYKWFKWLNNNGITMTKYNSIDGKTILDAKDDGVAVNWGGKWRMPTSDELQTLKYAITTAWTSDYKSTRVSGLVLTDKTDSTKELFFPAAGICLSGSVDNVGSNGYYWSSSLGSSDIQQAYLLYFSNGYVNWQNGNSRRLGRSLRGVVGE